MRLTLKKNVGATIDYCDTPMLLNDIKVAFNRDIKSNNLKKIYHHSIFGIKNGLLEVQSIEYHVSSESVVDWNHSRAEKDLKYLYYDSKREMEKLYLEYAPGTMIIKVNDEIEDDFSNGKLFESLRREF